MEWLTGADWGKIFVPQTPLLEIAVRGTVVYLSLFFLPVVVLIADAAQNAMADDYSLIPDVVPYGSANQHAPERRLL